MIEIAVLGVCSRSTYHEIDIPGVRLHLFDKERDMLTFDFNMPVIAHPPCNQWSRLRKFSKEDETEKALAFWCLLAVNRCGGILEHPHGSSFMRTHIGYGKCNSVNQSWFGFPSRKPTLLYCKNVRLLSSPLSFDLPKYSNVSNQFSKMRSRSTLQFNTWLVESVARSVICSSSQSKVSIGLS